MATAIGVALLSSHPPLHAQDTPKDELGERLKSEAAALAKPGFQLTPDEFEPGPLPDPPAEITEAGEEFVAAWREYQRALSLKSKKKPSAPAPNSRNVRSHADAYDKLWNALVHTDQPPQPEEFAQFFYVPAGNAFCGNSITQFAEDNARPILLSCLRNKRYREAVELLLTPGAFTELKRTILPALGFDLRKLRAGAWISGDRGHLEGLCEEGSDYAATLALRWAELRWNDAEEAKRSFGFVNLGKGPEVPTLELLFLLKDGNGVRHETKQQISDFLSKHATRLYPYERWLQGVPPGAEKWLISMAEEALQADKNSTRTLGATFLRNAGVEVAQPELKPAPRYRFFLNDQLWPPGGSDSAIGVSVLYNKPDASGLSGTGGAHQAGADGTIAVDPDYFPREKEIRRACFYGPPNSGNNPGNPALPWIRTDIPLPPKFGETTDIRIETVRLTIKPKLPRPPADYANRTISLDFGIAEGRNDPYLTRTYSVSPNKPLVLESVQPGEYHYRFQIPGAVTTSWQRVQVTTETNIFEPKIERGSSVIVPLSLPKQAKPETFRHFVQVACYRQLSNRTSPGIFHLERDGKPFEWPQQLAPMYSPEVDKVALPGLPIGQYKLTFRSSDEVHKTLPADEMRAEGITGWKSAAVTFAITAKSPFELQTDALKIQVVK